MRRIILLLLMLAGCAGPDSDPVEVAERFHAVRAAGDDRGIHELLTESDRAAVPLASFPAGLPAGITMELFAWSDVQLDSASLLSAVGDTATVALHVANLGRDTVRLLATHHPRKLLGLFEMDRVRWRVAMGLAEKALLDSLATALRAHDGAVHADAVEQAELYLAAAERHPAVAHPADLDVARSTVRRAAVAEALGIELRVAESFTGTRFVMGQVDNPSRSRVATLRLILTDAAGAEERLELWDIEPGASQRVRELTHLGTGRVTHRLERIQVF